MDQAGEGADGRDGSGNAGTTTAGGRPPFAWNNVRRRAPRLLAAAFALGDEVPVQIEVENLSQLREALEAGAKSVLLDNFSTGAMREAVAINDGRGQKRALLEASGGVNLDTVRAIAATGVDRISIGSLTKDLRATDFSLRIIG